jgi:hypothetical protein
MMAFYSAVLCFPRDGVQGMSRMSFGACSAITTVLHSFKEADLLGCLKDAGAANLCGETLLGKLSTRRTEALGSPASLLGKKCDDPSFMCSEAPHVPSFSCTTVRPAGHTCKLSKKRHLPLAVDEATISAQMLPLVDHNLTDSLL